MKLQNLPDGVRQLAEQRRNEYEAKHPARVIYTHFPARDADILRQAFSWGNTPEGASFWSSINGRDFAPYYGCRPVNYRKKIYL